MTTTPVTSETTLEPKRLLEALKPWVKRLVDDLRARVEGEPEVGDKLRAEYDAEFKAGRTGDAYGAWLEGALTQAAVAWILATVFTRFLEDNQFIEPKLSGPGERREYAIEHETAYYAELRTASVTDYLLATFEGLRCHNATALLFDSTHVPMWRLRLSGDAARDLLAFWRQLDPDTGKLVFDFTSEVLDTRFLGDLYQNLSEYARKKYALLQTPVFVEEFILDRTLEQAIETFGLEEVRMIDPTCGSGHFLLGGFERLLDKWRRQEPATNPAVLVRRALDGVFGVDINPYAVAVARFRLLIAALREAGIHRLADELDLPLNVAVGDTLLCAPERQNSLLGQEAQRDHLNLPGLTDYEDEALLTSIFGQRYHVVVGNPPYITVKDKVLNEAYRKRYPDSCHMKYSLGAPFTEVFFRLAVEAEGSGGAGYVGMINADSFMKREFGRKLIETVFPRVDLTHIISTAFAEIPGHDTPTVILFGRNRTPATRSVRVAMGIKREPPGVVDPAKGLVWTSILEQIDRPGSESPFISVADLERAVLSKHPWSIGGGGASELKELIDESSSLAVSDFISDIGFGCVISEEDAFTHPARYLGSSSELLRESVSGESVRDYRISSHEYVVFPYDKEIELVSEDKIFKALWSQRTILGSRADFNKKTYEELGRPYWEYHQIPKERSLNLRSIVFADISTHNHFIFDRGLKVYNRTAPVIKLPLDATDNDHFALLGLLNSSLACFWLKQVCHRKSGSTGGGGREEIWLSTYAFNGSNVQRFPIPAGEQDPATIEVARRLTDLAVSYNSHLPKALFSIGVPTRAQVDHARAEAARLRGLMIAYQEELDWHCYYQYGLLDTPANCSEAPPLSIGERAFEILLACEVESGKATTTWFSRHSVLPLSSLPSHWSDGYREVVEHRLDIIERNSQIRLLEQPMYKRRWSQRSWEDLEQAALRAWILDRLESPRYWAGEPAVRSVRELATIAAQDDDLVRAVELYTGQAGADIFAAIAPLVAAESVPFLPAQRYTESGKRKRAIWEDTWALQRREDAGEDVGVIPAPPKYKAEDFLHKDFWRLRGALDVPKERFIGYPCLEKMPDDSLVVGWAGWNHLDQATALSGFYDWASRTQGWGSERLIPLLAGVNELLPWLRQWHGEIDSSTGSRPCEDFEAFLDEEVRLLGLSRAELNAWAPAMTAKKRGRKGGNSR